MRDGRRIFGLYVIVVALLSVTRFAVFGSQVTYVDPVKEEDVSPVGFGHVSNGTASQLDPTRRENVSEETGTKKARSANSNPEGRSWNVDWMKAQNQPAKFESHRMPGRFQFSIGFRMNTSLGSAEIGYKKDFA